MTDNVVNLPEPGVVLDLDVATRDPKDVKPPFIVKVGGKTITFADPADLDWRDLASVEIPGDLIRVALSAEDRKHFQSVDLPTWKFGDLMDSYYSHYDLDEKIAQAKRRQALA